MSGAGSDAQKLVNSSNKVSFLFPSSNRTTAFQMYPPPSHNLSRDVSARYGRRPVLRRHTGVGRPGPHRLNWP